MAESFYAWSNISHVNGDKRVLIDRGSKVSRAELVGLREDDWDAMVESGAIRNRPYPAPVDFAGSAIDYLREQLQQSQADYAPVDEEEATSELIAVQQQAEEKPAPAPAARVSSKK
jgi:hypothetical protein